MQVTLADNSAGEDCVRYRCLTKLAKDPVARGFQ